MRPKCRTWCSPSLAPSLALRSCQVLTWPTFHWPSLLTTNSLFLKSAEPPPCCHSPPCRIKWLECKNECELRVSVHPTHFTPLEPSPLSTIFKEPPSILPTLRLLRQSPSPPSSLQPAVTVRHVSIACIQGGLSTLEEMCLSFLFYYPRPADGSILSHCLSTPGSSSFTDFFLFLER